MNDPHRLSEVGADDFEHDLILAARRDGPRPAALKRTLASIGVAVSLPLGVATVAEGAVATPVMKLGAVVVTKWLATGLVLGVATAGGAKVAERAVSPEKPALTSPVTKRPKPGLETSPRAALKSPSAAPAEAVIAPVLRPATVTSVPKAAAEPAAAASASLPEEVRSLDAARQALSRGDARGALALLGRYAMQFESGALMPEARVLEVRALLAAGERTRALTAAKRIMDRDPQSAHAEVVRALIARSSFR
jgi:hypothetical protein